MNVSTLLQQAPVNFPTRNIKILTFNMQRSWTNCLTGLTYIWHSWSWNILCSSNHYEMFAKCSVKNKITFHYFCKLLYYSSELQTVPLHFFRLFPMVEPFFTGWAVPGMLLQVKYHLSILLKVTLSEFTWTYSREGCTKIKENVISSCSKFRAQCLLLLALDLTA